MGDFELLFRSAKCRPHLLRTWRLWGFQHDGTQSWQMAGLRLGDHIRWDRVCYGVLSDQNP